MRCEVEVGEQVIVLTPVEHRLLHYLMLHAGHPVSTESLLQDVWQYPPGTGDPKVVQVNVAHLWAKLEPDPENPRFIRNLKGNSYIMNG
jgi:two-component system alkaline phosphatase synthesis response regulator PhoP